MEKGLLKRLLPENLNSQKIIDMINPNKDVDGLTAINQGKLFTGFPHIVPATPKAILKVLKYYKIPLVGKHAVIIGRSNLVGKPIAQLLMQENCTITTCHSKTQNLFEHTKNADILISCVG